MSSISAGKPAVRTRAARSEGWFAALGVKGRRAFRAAYTGYMLDAFDLIVLTLSLSAIGATFSVGTGATGALSTVTLSASAVGGILGGVLADRIGRARTLMLSVAVYSLFTFLSGLATSYEMLMVFRVFQGIGFGAEWGVGAVLVAELVRPESRGKALGVIQSAWAAGWALAVVAYLIAFELFAEQTAWRVLMCVGILPALLILYIRSRVEDPEVYREAKSQTDDGEVPLKQILRGKLLKTTVFASLLATGIQGGYYAMFTWIPTYLKTERDLTIVGTSGYLFVVIAGAFCGYLTAGFVHDRLGPPARLRAVRGLRGRVAGRLLRGPVGLEHRCCCSSASRWASSPPAASRASAPTWPSCTRRARGPRAGASVTTSAAASGRCSRASSASSRPRSGWVARSPSASSDTFSRCWPCWRCPRRTGARSEPTSEPASRRCAALGPMTSSSRASPARRCGRRTSRA